MMVEANSTFSRIFPTVSYITVIQVARFADDCRNPSCYVIFFASLRRMIKRAVKHRPARSRDS